MRLLRSLCARPIVQPHVYRFIVDLTWGRPCEQPGSANVPLALRLCRTQWLASDLVMRNRCELDAICGAFSSWLECLFVPSNLNDRFPSLPVAADVPARQVVILAIEFSPGLVPAICARDVRSPVHDRAAGPCEPDRLAGGARLP
jgi:hypothetical protein